MRLRHLNIAPVVMTSLGLLLGSGVSTVKADDDDNATYRVTIENLTSGQPLSPPVVATHGGGIRMFTVGRQASSELEAIAEDGNQIPMADFFRASDRVTDVVDVGMPLSPSGTSPMGFMDAVTVGIEAHQGDKLSLATMLICTNDGFTGLDRAKLPKQGAKIFLTAGYDAGTEDNTEQSEDIVDPCSGLGPILLSGDPNDNENAAVDSDPHVPIRHHPNISGGGDLTVAAHGWTDPVAKVTVTRVADDADDADRFLARLSGAGEVPLVDTDATGRAKFTLKNGRLSYKLNVDDIEGVTQAHIHLGLPNENGGVVAFLFGPVDPTGPIDGRLARGTVTEADLIGPLVGQPFSGFVEALRDGDLYVNVHTVANPSGEIRGQIGVKP